MLTPIEATLCEYALQQSLPILINLTSPKESVTRRAAALTCLSSIFAALGMGQVTVNETSKDSTQILQSYKDAVLGALVAGLKHESTRISSLNAMTHSIHIPKWFNEEELDFIARDVNEVLITEGQHSETWYAAPHAPIAKLNYNR